MTIAQELLAALRLNYPKQFNAAYGRYIDDSQDGGMQPEHGFTDEIMAELEAAMVPIRAKPGFQVFIKLYDDKLNVLKYEYEVYKQSQIEEEVAAESHSEIIAGLDKLLAELEVDGDDNPNAACASSRSRLGVLAKATGSPGREPTLAEQLCQSAVVKHRMSMLSERCVEEIKQIHYRASIGVYFPGIYYSVPTNFYMQILGVMLTFTDVDYEPMLAAGQGAVDQGANHQDCQLFLTFLRCVNQYKAHTGDVLDTRDVLAELVPELELDDPSKAAVGLLCTLLRMSIQTSNYSLFTKTCSLAPSSFCWETMQELLAERCEQPLESDTKISRAVEMKARKAVI